MSLSLDKSTWTRVAFGDVVRNVNETVRDTDAAGVDRVIAMEHLDPGELKIQRWGNVADSTTFTRRVKPGQTLFGKRRAYQRKVALAEFDGICSGDIYTFEAVEAHLIPQFLPFLVHSNGFFDHALGTSAGSLSPRTNWRDLATYEFALPPLDEQKRIADLLWAGEAHRGALVSSMHAARDTLSALSQERLSGLVGKVLLSEVAHTRSGPSFTASDVHKIPHDGATPILGITNTKPNGTIDMSDVSYVAGLPGSTGLINMSSLILVRTNGNRQRIGNVYRPPAAATGFSVSAFQFLMQAESPLDRDFLYWVLQRKQMQEQMSHNASGSVGLGNLPVRWLNTQEIPWSEDADQRAAVVRELENFEKVVALQEASLDNLNVMRASLLADIFGGH